MLSFLLLAALSAQDEGVILWNNIRNGMTMSELREIYVEDGKTVKYHGKKQTELEDFIVLDNCESEVEINHKTGVVDSVVVKGRPSMDARCSQKVFAALSAKYGQPDATTRKAPLFQPPRTIHIWSRDGVSMEFKYMDDGKGNMVGGGLVNSSWEMTYAASPERVVL